jgi:hypothetical protein
LISPGLAPQIGLVPDALSADAGKCPLELGNADKEGIMPRPELFARLEIGSYAVRCPHGTMSLAGLPPGRFELPTVETVLRRITVRGSIVGTRQDLEESQAYDTSRGVRHSRQPA